jgi:Ser/Thr protein kinase RdoA (MazF antagonist)
VEDSDPVLAFLGLTPEEMLDAVETRGIACDGRFLELNSYENRVYRVGLEDTDPVVAKFYRPQRWSDEAILEEHRFTAQLAQLEIPVVAPLGDAHGNTLHHAGPFRFALYPWRGGRAMEPDNPAQLEMLGRFIGRIHAAGAADIYHHRPAIDVESHLRMPGNRLLEAGFIAPHLERRWRDRLDELVEAAQLCLQRVGEVPIIRLHGDMHLGNILWTDRGPHIVDFDDARNGPAIQDLWMFLSGDGDYLEARIADLLRGYEQFHHFNRPEIRLVEVMRTLRMVYHAHWLASRWQDPAFPRAFPWFDSGRYWEQLLEDLDDQQQRMLEAVT